MQARKDCIQDVFDFLLILQEAKKVPRRSAIVEILQAKGDVNYDTRNGASLLPTRTVKLGG
jgi:hypothetical protein